MRRDDWLVFVGCLLMLAGYTGLIAFADAGVHLRECVAGIACLGGMSMIGRVLWRHRAG